MVERYFVTPEGAVTLKTRLKEILETDRPQNVADIERARDHGDLRENAEYHAAKDRQGMLDAEMRDLKDKVGRMEVVNPTDQSGDRIMFSATVTVVNVDTDEEVTYQIVGEHETDSKHGKISYRSPLARALIGKESGDEVVFNAPGGARTYEVLEVEFV